MKSQFVVGGGGGGGVFIYFYICDFYVHIINLTILSLLKLSHYVLLVSLCYWSRCELIIQLIFLSKIIFVI